MAIQPIDLQTMYSQMSNIAGRVSQEQQATQVNASLQQQAAVNQNAQKINTVKKTADSESKTGLVKEDGHQNSPEEKSEKKSRQNENQETQEEIKTEIREDYLGKHINITR